MKKISAAIYKSKASSEKAVAQFLTTAEALRIENEEVVNTLELIREEESKLAELREKGESLHAENAGIIERMTEFVKGAR